MLSYILTIGVLVLIIVGFEHFSWKLFYRKMAPLRFPSEKDATGSHNYWLLRIRIIVIAHTVLLCAFVIFFCTTLW